MIPNPNSQSYDQKIGISGEAMTVIMDEKSAHTLSSVIYSNHRRIEAVMRELCTNAYDSHIKARKEDTPIVVTLPTLGFPYLMIQDSGVGLAKEDGEVFFGTYFASGSQFEEKPTGYYGLGAKSPHAYTDAYEIIMVKDGLKNTMLCFKNENGVPAYNVLTANEATTDQNGVCFKVPVREKDFDSFHKAASFVLPMFAVQPTVLNAEDTLIASMQEMKDCKASSDFDRVPAMLFSEGSLPRALDKHPSKNNLMIRMGNILYPANARLLEGEGVVSRSGYFYELWSILRSKELFLLLEVDIATHGMTVEPGREKIITNAKNIATLEAMCERVVKRLKAEAKADYGEKTAWQVTSKMMAGIGFDELKEKDPSQYLKAYLYGAKPHLTISDISGMMARYNVNISVIRANQDFTKTSSMSAARFMSNNYGYFNPKQIRKIIILDDKKIKVGDISDQMRDMYIDKCLESKVHDKILNYKSGAQFSVLGILIRAKGKDSDTEGFASAFFGKGEYSMASDLMLHDVDISEHKRLVNATAEHYVFSEYYLDLIKQRNRVNLFKIKNEGARALVGPAKRLPLIYMTSKEFSDKKDDIVALYRLSGSKRCFSIVVSDEKVGSVPHFSSLEKVLMTSFRYTDIKSMINQNAMSEIVFSALTEEGSSGSSSVSYGHKLIKEVVIRHELLTSVLPSSDKHAIDLINKFRITAGSHKLSTSKMIELLDDFKILDLNTGLLTYKAVKKRSQTTKELISSILELFRKNPVEASFYFNINSDLVRGLKDCLLSKASEKMSVESQLTLMSDNTKGKREAA